LGHRKRRSLENQSTRVEFLLGFSSRDGKQLKNTLGIAIIESLGHGKRFGKMLEIRIALGELVEANFF